MQHGATVQNTLSLADPYLLFAVLAQITGNTSRIEESWEASQKPDRVADDVKWELRRSAADELSRLLEGDRITPTASPKLLEKLVQFVAGQPVPEHYVPMLLEEAGVIKKRLDNLPAVSAAKDKFLPHVAIIGSGLSGIATAIYLKKAGIPFTIYEKSSGVGGTWYDNRYPGCGVDTPSHFYAYSFAINPAWPRYFTQQSDMLRYIERCVKEFDLADHIHLDCSVDAAAYDDVSRTWRCQITPANGDVFEITANVLVSAVGQLNVPSYPRIAGLENFTGPVVHTARWTPDLDYRGKRVGLIGTGASGVQLGPTVAPDVERLLVFQRSPQWLSYRPKYHTPVGGDELWQLANIPYFVNWHRLKVIWDFSDKLYPALLNDPLDGQASSANNALRKQWSDYIKRKLDSRPDLLPKVMPDYAPLTKRAPVDFGWFDMLLRDNVDLFDQSLSSIDENAVITSDGIRHPVDILVLATGFKATRMLHTIRIRGSEGQDLRDIWGEDNPRAYLGMTVPGFPNFFIMYGPNTNVGHGGNLIFQGECQARYIAQAVRHMADSGTHELAVRPQVYDEYNVEVDQQLQQMVWGSDAVNNWFKNSEGRIVTNSPWSVVEYWRRTRTFSVADYQSE